MDEDLIDTDVLCSAVDDADLKELKRAEETFGASREYRKALHDHIKEFLDRKAKNKPKAKAKAKGSRSGTTSSSAPSAAAVAGSFTSWNVAELRQCLPPEIENFKWVLSKDFKNARWLVSHRLFGSMSKSFPLYGEQRA
eukprot:7846921-Lingulodinium_polyedra.AAC.1